MTHSIHKEGDILQIYFCVIFCETRHHAQAHVTSGALCALSLTVRRTQMGSAVGFAGQCLLWRLLLRLAAAAAAVVVVVVVALFLFFLKLVFNIASLQT